MKHFVKHMRAGFKEIFRRKGGFWFPVGKLPNTNEKVLIQGDRSAFPRSDPYWREQWKWIVLRAQHPMTPFTIYFESFEEGLCKCYSKKIRTPYVAMRVGPNATMVNATYAISGRADALHLEIFLKPDSESHIKEWFTKHSLLHKVTWI